MGNTGAVTFAVVFSGTIVGYVMVAEGAAETGFALLLTILTLVVTAGVIKL